MLVVQTERLAFCFLLKGSRSRWGWLNPISLLSCEDWIIATKSFCFLNSADTLLQGGWIYCCHWVWITFLNLHWGAHFLVLLFCACVCVCVCVCVWKRERERDKRERLCVYDWEVSWLHSLVPPNLEVIPVFSLSYDVSASLPSSF